MFFFCKQNGPSYANHIIKGIKQIDDGATPASVTIESGGVGDKHVYIVVQSHYGKPLATTFEIYGELIN